jgi:hypothetical protein
VISSRGSDGQILRHSRIVGDTGPADAERNIGLRSGSYVEAAGARIKYDCRHLGHLGGESDMPDTGASKRCYVSGAIRHGCRRPVSSRVPVAAGRVEIPSRAAGEKIRQREQAGQKQMESEFHLSGFTARTARK